MRFGTRDPRVTAGKRSRSAAPITDIQANTEHEDCIIAEARPSKASGLRSGQVTGIYMLKVCQRRVDWNESE